MNNRLFKNITLSLSSLLFGIQLIAQPSISNASMPKSGDTLRYSNASPTALPTGWQTGGSAQTWDFSKLSSTGQGLYEYLSSSKTPYAFYFFNQIGQKTADTISLGVITITNVYSFYTNNTKVFKAEGIGYSASGFPLAANYSDDDEIYQFPLNFNDKDTSTFKFNLTIPGGIFSVISTGKRINLVDGYGTVKTPYKEYSDALRVKTIVDQIDTVNSQFGKFAIPRKTISYKWLVGTERIPVLEIIGNELPNGTFTPNQVRYRDAYKTNSNPLAPRAIYALDKDSGLVGLDTFLLVDNTQAIVTSRTWSITPSGFHSYVSGSSATSRIARVVFNGAGLYSVNLRVNTPTGNDDTTGQDVIFVYYGAGNKNLISKQGVVLYPVPAQQIVNFQLPHGLVMNQSVTALVRLTTFDGKEMYMPCSIAENGTVTVDIAKISSGTYWISNVLTDSGLVVSINAAFIKK